MSKPPPEINPRKDNLMPPSNPHDTVADQRQTAL